VDRTRPAPWAESFEDWLVEAVEAGDEKALLDYRSRPDAEAAQPTDEHFLPLFVALGAAGPDAAGRTLHRGFMHGSLSMAAFYWA
jgi:4,5-DOPA dioxygenase extradiol